MSRTPDCVWFRTRFMRAEKRRGASDSPSNRAGKRSKLSKNASAKRLYTSAKAHSYRGAALTAYQKLCARASNMK